MMAAAARGTVDVAAIVAGIICHAATAAATAVTISVTAAAAAAETAAAAAAAAATTTAATTATATRTRCTIIATGACQQRGGGAGGGGGGAQVDARGVAAGVTRRRLCHRGGGGDCRWGRLRESQGKRGLAAAGAGGDAGSTPRVEAGGVYTLVYTPASQANYRHSSALQLGTGQQWSRTRRDALGHVRASGEKGLLLLLVLHQDRKPLPHSGGRRRAQGTRGRQLPAAGRERGGGATA